MKANFSAFLRSVITKSGLKAQFTGNNSKSFIPFKTGMGLSSVLIFTLLLILGICKSPAQADAGTWAATGSMNVSRAYNSSTLLLNGKVLVAGGNVSNGRTASAELYDPSTGKWTLTGSMGDARMAHVAVLLPNGKVLVAGGSSNASFTLSSAELYDPNTGTWTATGNMTADRNAAIAALMTAGPLSGKVLVAGGNTSCHPGYSGCPAVTDSAEIYDPETGTWTSTGKMAFASYFDSGSSNAIQLANGLVLVAGGDTCCPYYAFSAAQIFDPATQSWALTSNRATDAQGPRVLLADQSVLVAGGWKGRQGGEVTLASAEVYDTATGTWSAKASMSTVRNGFNLTRLGNGQVLAVGGNTGGWGECNLLKSAELYDPVSGTWSPAGTMLAAHNEHTATLLPNGKVLVAGGTNQDCSTSPPTASAELYTPDVTVQTPSTISGSDNQQLTGYATEGGKVDGVSERLPPDHVTPNTPAAQTAPALPPSECLFAWAERSYPAAFAPPGSPTTIGPGYAYRYYLATNSSLGVSWADNHFYYADPYGESHDEGPLPYWLLLAGCPPPTECLFNWAESRYPTLFAPAGTPTAVWFVYTYRRYSATNTILSVSSLDNHVYYTGADGVLNDEGSVFNWLFLAGCQ